VSTTSSAASSLDEERALIAQAQAALGAQDPKRAMAALEQHAVRFPNGQLSEERDGLRVVAGCDLGRTDARTRADQFLRARPRSPLAPRIRAECTK
jgi:hypothetical protein